jgi:multiple antibiotic resistance protein
MVSEGGDGARKGSRGLEIAAVPMACPLLVGPGAIVTTMLIVERGGLGHALLAGAIVFALVRAIFWLAGPIARLVGNLGLLILSRLMRIFIVAIGIHFVVAGIRAVFQLGR